MSNKEEASKPMSIDSMLQTIKQQIQLAEIEKDKIKLDASDAEQRNWFFFNGKVHALMDLESQLRLWLKTFELPANVTFPEDGQVNIRLSNGKIINLEQGFNVLHINKGNVNFDGVWICTINQEGVLVAPNSGDSCAALTHNLRNPREEEHETQDND